MASSDGRRQHMERGSASKFLPVCRISVRKSFNLRWRFALGGPKMFVHKMTSSSKELLPPPRRLDVEALTDCIGLTRPGKTAGTPLALSCRGSSLRCFRGASSVRASCSPRPHCQSIYLCTLAYAWSDTW